MLTLKVLNIGNNFTGRLNPIESLIELSRKKTNNTAGLVFKKEEVEGSGNAAEFNLKEKVNEFYNAFINDDASAADHIVKEVQSMEQDKVIPALINALKDRDLNFKKKAILFSCHVDLDSKGSDLLQEVFKILKEDEVYSVRNIVVFFLNEVSDKIGDVSKIASALAKSLKNDSSSTVRSTCAFLLGEMGLVEGAPALCEAIKNDPDSDVRIMAVDALACIGDISDSTIKTLKLAAKDKNYAVRIKAFKALENLGAPNINIRNLVGENILKIKNK